VAGARADDVARAERRVGAEDPDAGGVNEWIDTRMKKPHCKIWFS